MSLKTGSYLLEAAGCAVFLYGLWRIYPPAALIAAGVLAVVAAVATDRLR